ncbi:MAG: hypothetical protein H7Z74_07195 [Anaerolineae bacterium]|nr:hypothetical protein [Gemmatimonadaceae bacterium]
MPVLAREDRFLSATSGGALPSQRAEELLMTLPGVIAARVIATDAGVVSEVHLLTTMDVAPKQTVRNVESALIAQLGMKVDHRKISVATTIDHKKISSTILAGSIAGSVGVAERGPDWDRRRIYFEDVEVRRSRTKGVTCRVTLRKEEDTFIGESEGPETDRSRVELAARATLMAIAQAEEYALSLDGAKLVDAFEREFVFVGVTGHLGRENVMLTGSCEVRESTETASVLAVLDATNRWIGRMR